jgi:hypothetical protein
MELATIEQGEELMKNQHLNECNVLEIRYRTRDGIEHVKHWPDTSTAEFFLNHASELLQMAREVEGLKAALVEATESLNRGTKLMREYEGALIAGEAISALHRAMDKTD